MAGRPKGLPKTGGRKKGSPNKVTKDLRAAIIGAYDAVGGQAYLERVAIDDVKTFCTLLGKVIPTTVAGDEENPIVTKIVREIVHTRADAPRD
jgi:hypothetical protein